MIRMFVRHPVADYANWKQHYDAFDDERKGMGVVGDAVLRAEDNPNEVTVWHDFDSLASAKQFSESPRLREVMSQAGVTGAPTIWFTKPA